MQTEEAAARPHRTHHQGGLQSCVGQFFIFSFLFLSLPASLFFSLLYPLGEKRSVLKHVLNITIFTFSCFKQKGGGWRGAV